jgi:hypothetical protein
MVIRTNGVDLQMLIRSPATGNFSAELKALTSALLVLSQISVSAFSCASVAKWQPALPIQHPMVIRTNGVDLQMDIK